MREFWGPRSTRGLGAQYKNSQRIFVIELEDDTKIEVIAEDLVDGEEDGMYAEENPHYHDAIRDWRKKNAKVRRPEKQGSKTARRKSRRLGNK